MTYYNGTLSLYALKKTILSFRLYPCNFGLILILSEWGVVLIFAGQSPNFTSVESSEHYALTTYFLSWILKHPKTSNVSSSVGWWENVQYPKLAQSTVHVCLCDHVCVWACRGKEEKLHCDLSLFNLVCQADFFFLSASCDQDHFPKTLEIN